MLFSPGQRLALALFPKTAGRSLTAWFEAAFPDVVWAEPGKPHIPVLKGLVKLGLLPEPPTRPRSMRRLLMGPFSKRPAAGTLPDKLMIIGVVREPFEMLVSLYAFWRRVSTLDKWPVGGLPYVAATGSFREFIELGVVKRRFYHYHDFFGVGSVAWPATRLLDFNGLEPGLQTVCREHGIEPPANLPQVNVAPRSHDFDAHRAQVSDLLPAIHEMFRWYYEEAETILVRGDAAPPNRVAA